MSTKRNKRITKQVRVGEKAHDRLKFLAKEEELTMSKMVDEIILSTPSTNQINEQTK